MTSKVLSPSGVAAVRPHLLFNVSGRLARGHTNPTSAGLR